MPAVNYPSPRGLTLEEQPTETVFMITVRFSASFMSAGLKNVSMSCMGGFVCGSSSAGIVNRTVDSDEVTNERGSVINKGAVA
jgi:hypothetical protein